MFRVSYKEIISYSLIGVLLLVLINLIWSNSLVVITITSVIGSIFASVIISIIFQNHLHDAFQVYSKIGMRKAFKNFEDAFDHIKHDISKGKKVDVFFMYGSSFLNSASISIKDCLSKKDAKLRFFIFSDSNPYVDAYGNQWSKDSSKYDPEGIKKLIRESKGNILKIYNSIDVEKRSSLEVYEILNAPLSYSYYRVDDKLYFVPSKLTTSKFFKHPVFLFEKSDKDENLYNSIENEIETMINNQEINKIFPL